MIAALAVAACASPPTPSPTPTPTSPTQPPPAPSPALGSVTVTAVGTIQRGGSSGDTLTLSFIEAGVAAIGSGPGSFEVTLSDQAGSTSTVSFVGVPSTAASSVSLGASASVSGGTLTVHTLDSNATFLDRIVVTGIGIAAASSAAPGPIEAKMGSFAGSLAGGAASDVLVSPGSVAGSP